MRQGTVIEAVIDSVGVKILINKLMKINKLKTPFKLVTIKDDATK